MNAGGARSPRRLINYAPLLFVTLVCLSCRRDDPAELERAARNDFATGRLEEANDKLTRLASIRPLTVAERVLRAQIAHDQGRLEDALRALDDPQEPTPVKRSDAALLSAWRGWLEMQRHHLRAAEADLKKALALEPDRMQARRQLIDLYALQGRTKELTAESRRLAKRGPLDFSYLYVWTFGQREGLDPAEQAKVLEDAVQADPDDRASRLAFAECLRKRGQLDQAAVVLRPLSLAEPDVRALAARIALDQGELESAQALLTPRPGEQDDSTLSQLRGQFAMFQDHPEAAVKPFQQAVKLAPEDRDAQFGLGQALSLVDKQASGAPYLRAARGHDHLQWLVQSARPPARRRDPVVLQEIGAVCLALGRQEQARAWLKLALSYSPENPQLQKMLAKAASEP